MKINIPNTEKHIKITRYSSAYFKSMKQFYNAYELLFTDYIEYVSKTNETDYLSFLKDSVKNNYFINDYIEEMDFTVNEDTIKYSFDNSLPKIGSFIIDDYEISVCYSYAFIDDKKNNKKYMYYGD